MTPKDRFVLEDYLQKAEASLQMATLGIDSGNHYGAYHLSLTFELVIKAVRLSQGLPATANHVIYKLLDGLDPAEPWTTRIQALEMLADYSTTYRYPHPSGRAHASPSVEEARAYVAELRDFINLARKELLA